MSGGSNGTAVVIPTYNEAEALLGLLRRLDAVQGIVGPFAEVLVVDDGSPDGTADVAVANARGLALRVFRRTGRRSLSASVIAGMRECRAEAICVLDADGSHPPELIPDLLAALRAGCGIAVASRYVPGGRAEGWPLRRLLMSKAATALAHPLTRVRDPMSGFFALHRTVVEGIPLVPCGFKVLLEVLVHGHYERVVEVPYTFSERRDGRSKMTLGEQGRYLRQLVRLYPFLTRMPFARPIEYRVAAETADAAAS